MKIYKTFITLLTTLSLLASARCAIDADVKTTLSSANLFAADIFAELAGEKVGENLVVSAPSVHYLLAIMALGARGNTSDELSGGLHLFDDPLRVLRGYKSLMTNAVDALNVSTIRMANRVYVDHKLIIKDEFRSEIDGLDPTVFDTLDDNNVKSEEKINVWVDEVTNHKIPEFLAKDELSPSVKIYFVNAAYFKADWKYAFAASQTRLRPFHFENGVKGNVSTMVVSAKLESVLSKELNAECIKLPYKDEDLRMVVCMPSEGSSLLELESKLKSYDLNELTYVSREVTLELPKFAIESDLSLEQNLHKMGILRDYIDLSGMVDDVSFELNQIRQKAYVSVDENGSEGYAATDLDGRTGPIEIKVNKPFYYAIVSSGLPLFQGHVYSPKA